MSSNPLDSVVLHKPEALNCLDSLKQLVEYVKFYTVQARQCKYKNYDLGACASAYAALHAINSEPDILGMTICHERDLIIKNGKPYFSDVVKHFKHESDSAALSNILCSIDESKDLNHIKDACNEMKHHRLIEIRPHWSCAMITMVTVVVTLGGFTREGTTYPEYECLNLVSRAQRFFLQQAANALLLL